MCVYVCPKLTTKERQYLVRCALTVVQKRGALGSTLTASLVRSGLTSFWVLQVFIMSLFLIKQTCMYVRLHIYTGKHIYTSAHTHTNAHTRTHRLPHP